MSVKRKTGGIEDVEKPSGFRRLKSLIGKLARQFDGNNRSRTKQFLGKLETVKLIGRLGSFVSAMSWFEGWKKKNREGGIETEGAVVCGKGRWRGQSKREIGDKVKRRENRVQRLVATKRRPDFDSFLKNGIVFSSSTTGPVTDASASRKRIGWSDFWTGILTWIFRFEDTCIPGIFCKNIKNVSLGISLWMFRLSGKCKTIDVGRRRSRE